MTTCNKCLRLVQFAAIVFSLALTSIAMADEAKDSSSEHRRPIGTDQLSVEIPSNTIHLFRNEGFEGDQVAIDNVTEKVKTGQLQSLPAGMNDSVSSLRWNLPPHVLVILYEDAGGKGEQAVLWGKGELKSLDWWDINDKVSRWSWYTIRPADDEDEAHEAYEAHEGDEAHEKHEAEADEHAEHHADADDEAERDEAHEHVQVTPTWVKPLSMKLKDNTMQLYRDTHFENDMVPVTSVTDEAEGKLHPLTGRVEDSLSLASLESAGRRDRGVLPGCRRQEAACGHLGPGRSAQHRRVGHQRQGFALGMVPHRRYRSGQ